ncbi:MAG: InlB B-repeat-containing protein [Spirochaetales bacterium]|nr:InlB B-repeat-containing protein [Spirochaetales bacterium]
MTKRFFKLFFILSCAVCLALSLAACDDPNDTPSTPETKKYTVTFETNGGSAIQAVTVEQGKTVAKPTDPTKEGNTFDGWYTDKDCTKAFDFKTAVAGNITLYAKWKIKTYTVTFDSNGVGVTPPQAQKVEHGKKASKPAALSVEGHVFNGWFTDKDSKKEFSFDTAITADITLYAGWDFKYWEITFDTKGGNELDPKKVKHGETVDELPTPTKSGYIFDCWCIDEDCTISFDVATKVTESFTLYARWTKPDANSWTVTLELNGGSIADSKTTIIVKKDEAIGTLPIPTKEGNTFDGWYEDNNTFTKKVNSTFIVTKNIELYAKWTPNTSYTVTFDSNRDGVTPPQVQKIEHGKKATEPAALSAEGYIFDGWYEKGSETAFDFNTQITRAITLYAKWYIDAAPELDVATLRDDSDGSTDLYEKGSYKIDNIKDDNGYTTSFTIAATNLKKHRNASGTEGYWIGFQLTVNTNRVTKVHYRTKNSGDFKDAALESLDSKNKGFAMYYDYSEKVEKYMEVYFTNDKGEKSPIYKYNVSFNVILASDTSDDENKNIDAGITIGKVTLRDGKAGTTEGLFLDYNVSRSDDKITITATNLKKHHNADDTEGYWIGFQMVVGNDNFSNGEYHLTWNGKESNGDLEDLPNGKGVALYYDYAELTKKEKKEDNVEVYFTNGGKTSKTYKYTVDLSGVTLYIDIEESITTAKLEDRRTEGKIEELYKEYSVKASEESGSDFTYNVTISAENLKSHQNATGKSGYWVGFQIAVDESVWSHVSVNNKDKFALEDLPDNEKGVALYFDYAKVTDNKKRVTVQFSNDNGNSEEYTFNVIFDMKWTNMTISEVTKQKNPGPDEFTSDIFEAVTSAISNVSCDGSEVTVTFNANDYNEISFENDDATKNGGNYNAVYLQIGTNLQGVTAGQIEFVSGYNWDDTAHKEYNFENGTFKFWLPANGIDKKDKYIIEYKVGDGNIQTIVINYVLK